MRRPFFTLRRRKRGKRMDTVITEIVQREWDFFQKVQNEGGRADCQDDPQTFQIMRRSQFLAWSERARESYLEDLIAAKESGRNLLTEKYAYMMKFTASEDFARIEKLLPPITEEKERLAEELAQIHIEWRISFENRYPRLAGKGRPLRSEEDTVFRTSFESYLKGELYTYSEKTLKLCLEDAKMMQEKGENQSIAIMQNTVRAYGYRTLEEAEGQ